LAGIVHKIDGKRLFSARRLAGMSRKNFALLCGCHHHLIYLIEVKGHQPGPEVTAGIRSALTELRGRFPDRKFDDPDAVIVKVRASRRPRRARNLGAADAEHSWLHPARAAPADRAELERAADWDMRGRPDRAVDIVRRLLRRPGVRRTVQQRAVLSIRLATYLDRDDRPDEALDVIDELLSGWPDEPSRRWATYHRAVCLRHCAELSRARPGSVRTDDPLEYLARADRDLKELERSERGRILRSVVHQRGTVAFERWHRERTQVNLDRAVGLFQKCIRLWKGETRDHRRAYPWRRLGRLHADAGDLCRAVECLDEARAVFAWHHCVRYEDEVREEIDGVLSRLREEWKREGP
jgi:hypothetical protein